MGIICSIHVTITIIIIEKIFKFQIISPDTTGTGANV